MLAGIRLISIKTNHSGNFGGHFDELLALQHQRYVLVQDENVRISVLHATNCVRATPRQHQCNDL